MPLQGSSAIHFSPDPLRLVSLHPNNDSIYPSYNQSFQLRQNQHHWPPSTRQCQWPRLPLSNSSSGKLIHCTGPDDRAIAVIAISPTPAQPVRPLASCLIEAPEAGCRVITVLV